MRSRAIEQRDEAMETERLVLEPLVRAHAAELFELLSDARLYQYIPQDPPVSIEALAERYGRLESRRSPSGEELWLNWAVREKAGRRYVGTVQATVRRDGSTLLAYEIGPAHWRRGFATEACRRVIEALFAAYGAERILAEIDTRNEASIRLVERLGFEPGSVRTGADFFKGSSSDEITYTLHRTNVRGSAQRP